MNKNLAIALLVIVVLVLGVSLFFLARKVTRKIGRLHIGSLIVLIAISVILIIFLIRYVFFSENKGASGGNSEESGISEEIPDVPENTVLLRADEIWIEGEDAPIDRSRMKEKLNEYLKAKIRDRITVTIRDDFSSSMLVKEVEQIFKDNDLEKDKSYKIEIKDP